MLSSIKVAIFLWPLLLTPSVISRSFVTKVSEQQHFWKRDVAAVETNSTKPDIYSFDITSNITYRYAVTTVSSRVANPANTSKEISFHVTLPESAFISKFLMVIKDKVYEAYVKEKEEAKKDYQEAVDHGFTAGLVSMNTRDSNVFTVSVNVEANGKVTFNLTYEQLLTRTLGQYENIINVNPGQVIKTFNVHVNIEESSNITSLQVSDLKTGNEIDSNNTKSIDAKIDRPAGESARIAWSPDGKTQEELSADGVNGQFIVRYDVDHTSHPNQILVDEGYFVHFYSPTDLKTLPKHVLFVLDISGSMGGRKIEQLREALTLILADIGKGDYFSILLFSDAVQLWTLNGTVGDASPPIIYDEVSTTTAPEVEINHRFIVPATPEHIKKATEFAKTLQETGGTNIIAAIRKSLEIAKWGQKQPSIKAKPLIIFLTDGQPNVEMSDPEEINKNVNKLNSDKYPIFSLAFGQGADFEFLRKLSLSNAGFARNIYVASDTTLQLKNFYKEVASPLLSNVTFEYVPGQIAEGYVTKRVFNNLYNGSELVVAGKLSNNTKGLGGNLTYEGVDGFFCIPLPTPFDIPAQNPRAHLEKLFAYMYIKELLDKDLISDDKNSTYKQKALKLSLEYGFVTPLTSLVVVKPNETDSGASIKNANALPSENIGHSFPMFAAVPASMQFAPAAFSSNIGGGLLSRSSFDEPPMAMYEMGKYSGNTQTVPTTMSITSWHASLRLAKLAYQKVSYKIPQFLKMGVQSKHIQYLSMPDENDLLDLSLKSHFHSPRLVSHSVRPQWSPKSPTVFTQNSLMGKTSGFFSQNSSFRKMISRTNSGLISRSTSRIGSSGGNGATGYHSSMPLNAHSFYPMRTKMHYKLSNKIITSKIAYSRPQAHFSSLSVNRLVGGSSNFHAFNGNAPVPAPLSPISTTYNPNYPTMSSDIDDFPLTTGLPLDANVTGFNVAYNLSQIVWLQNKTEIQFPNSNNSYSVFTGDLPNTEFQSCMLPNSNNTLSHCRHLAQCIIPQILSSFNDFLPYGEQCVIDARFVGICCPNQSTQKLPSTTGFSSTDTSTLVPTISTTTA